MRSSRHPTGCVPPLVACVMLAGCTLTGADTRGAPLIPVQVAPTTEIATQLETVEAQLHFTEPRGVDLRGVDLSPLADAAGRIADGGGIMGGAPLVETEGLGRGVEAAGKHIAGAGERLGTYAVDRGTEVLDRRLGELHDDIQAQGAEIRADLHEIARDLTDAADVRSADALAELRWYRWPAGAVAGGIVLLCLMLGLGYLIRKVDESRDTPRRAA